MFFAIAMISSCVGCCVRAARTRQVRQYQAIRNSQPPLYGTVVVAPAPVTVPPYPYAAAGSVHQAPPNSGEQPPKYQDPVY